MFEQVLLEVAGMVVCAGKGFLIIRIHTCNFGSSMTQFQKKMAYSRSIKNDKKWERAVFFH